MWFKETTRRVWTGPVVVFCVCFGAYLSNGTPLTSGDATGNMLFSVNLLKHHSFLITPPQVPGAFVWTWEHTPETTSRGEITEWDNMKDEAYRAGHLTAEPYQYMAPTVYPDQYANTFGIGAMLILLPVYAALDLVTDLVSNRPLWWYSAKVTASLLTAWAAVFIFLTMRQFVTSLPAVLGALAFGLGTSAWTLSSQALWQQTPYLFFLSLGTWWLVGVEARPRGALYCGAAFGMATLCRPTGAMIVVLAGLYLLWLAPPRFPGVAPGGVSARAGTSAPPLFLTYVIGGLPFALLLGAYNAYYFGGPFVFGQDVVVESMAQTRGATGAWETPLAEGLAGLLFSPSRGLFVYSPVMVLGFIGAVMTWHDPRKYAPLIPLQVAVLVQFVVSAKWYDWWGGWSYGPRPIVDTGVFLALLMIPVIIRSWSARWMRGIFVTLLLYSVAVQVVGAWAYNEYSWNNKNDENVDQPEHRSRLWSIKDSQIVYYVTSFQAAQLRKESILHHFLAFDGPIVSVSPPRTSSEPTP